MQKVLSIFVESMPILLMIGLIPVVKNDYLLTSLYVVIIVIALILKREKNDFSVLIFGFVVMILFEYLFISTGVETFTRNTLLGSMPLWLPFIWAYGFIAIKRAVKIID